jgi:hypothetical protein
MRSAGGRLWLQGGAVGVMAADVDRRAQQFDDGSMAGSASLDAKPTRRRHGEFIRHAHHGTSPPESESP